MQQASVGVVGQVSLRSYLETKIAKHQRYALARRLIAWALLLAATFVGALVVINVGTKWFSADQLSALTGAGAVLLALLRVGKFQEQASWNKLKQRKLEALCRRIVYEGMEERLVSAELTKADEELERMRVWLQIPGELSTLVPDVPPRK